MKGKKWNNIENWKKCYGMKFENEGKRNDIKLENGRKNESLKRGRRERSQPLEADPPHARYYHDNP